MKEDFEFIGDLSNDVSKEQEEFITSLGEDGAFESGLVVLDNYLVDEE